MSSTSLPSVSSPDFLQRVKSLIELREGQTRDSSGRFVTMADLESIGVTEQNIANGDRLINYVSGDNTPPYAPTGLLIENNVINHTLSWSNPSNDDLSHIEVWRSEDNQARSFASLVAIVTAPTAKVMLSGVSPRHNYYYWIRAIDFAGNYSPWCPSDQQGGELVSGEFAESINALLAQLTDDARYNQTYTLVADSFRIIEPSVGLTEGKKVFTTGNINGQSTVGINGDLIVDGTVLTRMLSASCVDADKISAGAIVSDKIAANAITAGKISAGAVTTSSLAAQAITTDKLAANSITSDKIVAGAIQATDIAAGAIVATHLSAGCITADAISSMAIRTQHLQSGLIISDKIASSAIMAQHLQANSVTAGAIAAASIQAGHIQAGAITANALAAGSVTANSIAAGAISAASLAAGSITTVLLNNNAVTIPMFATGGWVSGNGSDKNVVSLSFTNGAATARILVMFSARVGYSNGNKRVTFTLKRNGSQLYSNGQTTNMNDNVAFVYSDYVSAGAYVTYSVDFNGESADVFVMYSNLWVSGLMK